VIPFLQAIIGEMITVVAILAILGGVMKLFQIATSLNEIKDLLTEIRRNTRDHLPPVGSEAHRYPSESPLHADGSESDAHSLHPALSEPEP
jgi:hypothetical protein